MAAVAKPLQEAASFRELLGLGALGKVAADHDEVGLQFIDAAFNRLHQPRVMRAEVQIGQMNDASHKS